MLDILKVRYKNDAIRAQAKHLIPDGNLTACLTCGTCTSGCPAKGLQNMDPGKFIRMAVFHMDEELKRHFLVSSCTMSKLCHDICPMPINIPRFIFHLRSLWTRKESPKNSRKPVTEPDELVYLSQLPCPDRGSGPSP